MNRKLDQGQSPVLNFSNLLNQDGEVYLLEDFIKKDDEAKFFSDLQSNINWRQEEVRVFGRTWPQPRLVAWHGDLGLTYKYSGLELISQPWTPTLLYLKEKVEEVCQSQFNSVLLNLYRNERDSNGWHSDDEPELGCEPVIASVSLGETRDFCMRHKKEKNKKIKIPLTSGSLLIMRGRTQESWSHTLPKRSRPLGSRINLTFRWVHHTN